MSDAKPESWTLQIGFSTADPEQKAVIVVRHDPLPQFRLEIHAPEVVNAASEHEQNKLARRVIQNAATALQAALDGSALPGYIEKFARRVP